MDAPDHAHRIPSGSQPDNTVPRYDKWQDGTLRTTELQTFRLQYWSSREFEGLLAEAGFIGTRVTADYQDTSTPAAASNVWTFQATGRPA